jgi:NAD(P)-dependent dehydrogenase (short-subunit alcohol dehydrogenase family)
VGLLEGKVAIVTGGGRGIGRQHCLGLAAHGAAVVVNDADVNVDGTGECEPSASAVVSEIQKRGGRAAADTGSVTDWRACSDLVERAVSTFGQLDIVINNAGILRDETLKDLTEASFDAVLDVHLKGTLAMTKHASEYWARRATPGAVLRPGRIINTSSSAAVQGYAGGAAYAAAKSAIIGLTFVTAVEMASLNVTCNVISPVSLTRLSDPSHSAVDPPEDRYFDAHPGTASPLVVYLASDEAGWLSGQFLRVEGNTLIRMEGWRQGARYSAPEGQFIDPLALGVEVRRMYECFPAGMPAFTSTALRKAASFGQR